MIDPRVNDDGLTASERHSGLRRGLGGVDDHNAEEGHGLGRVVYVGVGAVCRDSGHRSLMYQVCCPSHGECQGSTCNRKHLL